VLSDEDELGADVHRRLVRDVAVTAVSVEPVEDAVEAEAVVLGRLQRHHVPTEVIVPDRRQRVVAVEQAVLVLEQDVGVQLPAPTHRPYM